MSRPKILSIGEVLWDVFPDGARFGGAPANFACHAALLGGDVTIVSAIGDDDQGRDALSILRRFELNTSLMQIIPAVRTGSVSVELDIAGKPTFIIHENSAWDNIAWTDELATHIEQVDAVYFGTLGQRSVRSRTTIRRTAERAAALNIPRILDVNLRQPFFDAAMIRESLALASIIKISDDELPSVLSATGVSNPLGTAPEAALRELLECNTIDMIVMTRGAQGALLVTPTHLFDQQGIPVEVVSTVGAGDSFTAAFLMGLLQRQPFDETLRNACTLASQVCSIAGAVPVM